MTGRLRRLLSRHCSAATMERLVDPILTDIHIEAAEANLRGRRWAGRWIRGVGLAALVKALAFHEWNQFWRFQTWPDDDRRALARSMAYSFVATAAAILLLTAPVLIRWRALGWENLPRYFLILQTLRLFALTVGFGLSIGLFIGLIYGFRTQVVSLRPKAAVMVIVMLCSIGSFVLVSWGDGPAMALGDLRRRIDDFRQSGLDVAPLAFAYHVRWALAAAPIVLSTWALLLTGRLAACGRLLLGIVAIASFAAYAALVIGGRVAVFSKTLPPIAGAWLPNLVFVAAMILLTRRTPNEYPSRSERRTTPVSL